MVRAWVFWIVGLSGLGVVATTCVAWGATYNFYFNNVEQGENGQASPSVLIQDGKLANGQAQTLPVPGATPSPTPSPADVAQPTPVNPDTSPAKESEEEAKPAEAGVSSATAEVAEWKQEKKSKRFRFDLTALIAAGSGGMAGTPGLLGGFTWNFMPALGVRAFGGFVRPLAPYMYSGERSYDPETGTYPEDFGDPQTKPILGLEAEWNPIRVNFWGLEDWFSMGVLLGASNLHVLGDNWVTMHTGIRARMNLSENLGLLAQTRFNLGYATFEAGLTFGF